MFRLKPLKYLGYKKEDGLWTIELKLDKIEQIFDKKDPSPFRDRDLEESVVDYISSAASEIGAKKIGKLKVLYGDEELPNIELIKTSISNFFNYQHEVTKRNIYKTLGIGFKSLLIGVVCMLSSLSIIFYLEGNEGLPAKFISEGALLFAWVSLWKPFNVFLYEWWPSVDDLKIYRKLSEINIDIHPNK